MEDGSPTLVSIIIPCYNPPSDIFRNTLTALKKITPTLFSLIIVDDGSSDKRFIEIAKQHFPEFLLVQTPINKGLSAARNLGVENCNTKYYIQLDSDDQTTEEFIRKGVDVLEEHPEWSFCNSWIKGFGSRKYSLPKGFEHGANMLITNAFPPIAMIRTAVDREIGGHNETIRQGNEDWDYWLKMAFHGHWGYTIPEYLNYYYQHKQPTYWQDRDSPNHKARFRYKLWWRYRSLIYKGFWHKIRQRWKEQNFPLSDLESLREYNRRHPEYPNKFQLFIRLIFWSLLAIGISLKND